MGRKDLIEAARLNAPPRGGNIGRGMKVNKEEVVGMYAALERYVNLDHDREWKIWEDRIAHIENAAKKTAGVRTSVTVPPIANHTPTLNIEWDPEVIKVSREEFQERLRRGNPSIEVVAGGGNSINITAFMMEPGQEIIVAARIAEELTKASATPS